VSLRRRRDINASELRTFGFCRRAWYLEQIGTPSEIEDQRRSGTVDHQHHAERVVRATEGDRALSGVIIIGVLVIVALVISVILGKLI
jgi:hypothetical protein